MHLLIGERLKELRRQKGLSQMDLALRSKLSCNFIGMMERDQQNPSLDSYIRIAEGLGMGVLEMTLEFLKDNNLDIEFNLNEPSSTYTITGSQKEIIVTEMSAFLFSMPVEELESLLRVVKSMCKKA